MKPAIRWLVFGAAILGTGFSMPSCPGQQAVEQRISSFEKKEAELNQRIQALESRAQAQSEDLGQAKQLVAQVAQTVLAQKEAIAKLETDLRRMSAARAAAPKPSAKKAAAKPAPRKAARPAKKRR